MVHVAVNKYDFEKINILEYAFGEGVVSWVYDTVCCTLYSCTMYDQRSVAYTNKNILFVSHVVYQSRTIRIIHEYTERYGGYNISPFVEKAL